MSSTATACDAPEKRGEFRETRFTLPEGMRASGRRRATDGEGEDEWTWPRWRAGARRWHRPLWSHPGRKLARNEMVGFGLLYFFLFVPFLVTKKIAQPFTPLHVHLSGPESRLQRPGETETTVPLTPQSGWLGLVLLLRPTPGLQPPAPA